MIGLDRHFRKNAQAHAGGDRGLNAGEIRTRVGHMPGAASAFERMNGAGSIETTGGKTDQRYRSGFRMERMALAGHPMDPLRPHRDPALFTGGTLEQSQVEIASLEIAPEIRTLIGADIESQVRVGAR